MLRGESRGQGGYSLAEVIIAIMLLSGFFIGLASAIFTVLRATATNERIQAVDTALVSYAGILRTSETKPDGSLRVPYVPCGSAGTAGSDAVASAYEAATADAAVITTTGDAGASAAGRKPDGMVIDIVGVDAWDSVAKTWVDDCAVPDRGAQRIRYEVRMGGTTRAGETVKRYPGPVS